MDTYTLIYTSIAVIVAAPFVATYLMTRRKKND